MSHYTKQGIIDLLGESLADPAPLLEQIALKANTTDVNTALTGKSDTGHSHTLASLGIGNVNNTADTDKPVSTAQQTALNLKQNKLGAMGAVTQLTSKATGVTLNALCGNITLHTAALAAAAEVSFTLTNNQISADDLIIVNIKSGATANTYSVQVDAKANGSCRICVGNYSTTSRSEAIVISFGIIKTG